MPYIKRDKRPHSLDGFRPENPGELNYALSAIVGEYWRRTGNYQGINDIVGALEGTKLEFYRRITAPYEDTKIRENGDVY